MITRSARLIPFPSGKPTKLTSTSHSFFATPPRTTIAFPQLKHAIDVPDESTPQPSVESGLSANSITVGPTRPKQRPGRKTTMPPVKDKELVPGAIFTGRVISIHAFGAFVDIGAFKDGLVHVSQLIDKYVKDVNNIVSVGQVVKVRLLKVETDTGKIYLSMREPNDNTKTRSTARESQRVMKTMKLVKGQEVVGRVKKLGRAGVFISLPEGEEGFLPSSEEAVGNSVLEVGQEVKVRVLQVNRGTLTLTMKKEESAKKVESEVEEEGVVHKATNPFVMAFRRNKDIAEFLDMRERMKALGNLGDSMVILDLKD